MAHGWRSRSSGLRDLTCRSSIRSREAVWRRHSRSFGGTRGRGGLTRPLRLGPARSVSGVLYPGGVRATPRRPREGEGAVMIESNQAPAPSAFFDGEVLMRLVATALVTLSRQRSVSSPAYPAKVQNAYNHLVLHCLKKNEQPPGSVAEMVSWAATRPLVKWPVSVSEELLGGDGLLVDKDTRTPTQTCLEWEVHAADPAAELFENERLLEAIAVCRDAEAPDAYTAFRR